MQYLNYLKKYHEAFEFTLYDLNVFDNGSNQHNLVHNYHYGMLCHFNQYCLLFKYHHNILHYTLH